MLKQEWCTPPSFSHSLVACPSEDGMSGSLFLVSLSLPDRLSTQNFQEFPPEIANSPGIDHTQPRKRSRKKKVWYGRIISAAESFLGVGSGTRIFRNWLQYKTEFNKNSYWKKFDVIKYLRKSTFMFFSSILSTYNRYKFFFKNKTNFKPKNNSNCLGIFYYFYVSQSYMVKIRLIPNKLQYVQYCM